MRATFEEVYSQLSHRQDETPWEHFVFVFRVCLSSAELQAYGSVGINRSWLVELGLLDYEGPLPAWLRTGDEQRDGWLYLHGPLEDLQPCTQTLCYTREDFLAAMENLYGPAQMADLLLRMET